MDRDLLPHLPVVLAVARRGGFAAAAGELGMSPSAVSHAVRMVEDRIGAPLFARTTRSVALTEAGQGFVATLGPALQDLQDGLERLRLAGGRVTGVLRLNVPRIAQPIALTPILLELARRHPELVVEVTSDDRLADIVAEGFDAGVRLGGMIAQDMVAVRLTPPFRAIMVAAPAYLAARGEPAAIAELARHNCIGFRLLASGGVYAWDLVQDGEDVAVGVTGTVRVTDSSYAKDLALAGAGIAYVFEPLVRQELRDGRLRWLLPATAIEEAGLFLYHPRRAGTAPKLRAFIDVAKEILAAAA
ncbi:MULTISPECIES: LysR substrate-binding domain-containing protein [Inquilinus]|uniref:DNA-binding transcriptional LysR family regulator n=1 Tax=Inquilinus ginsengisoli TaxID=363840 RepID=A0ABU1JTW6_9PROT|nr:LysR substrate-binding domain-containing protein [Inquilinus ginsengisoli]MDR6291743.1 DNA-binding transcriptional LysR family regulator [Inquilinus ginsengisoli]